MVYIVYIKHNNMEMKKKKKKKVLVLYPSGNYLYPTTGGELYDSYLFKRITTVQRNYPIGSVDLTRNHSSDVLV